MMQLSRKKIFILSLLFTTLFYALNAYAVINVVAAENIYGEVAKEIGGKYVKVTNILNNPNQDPHLFTVNAGTAKLISEADIVIYNGADYDTWMEPLLSLGKPNKLLINVSELTNMRNSSNPHIWYKPETIPSVADYFVSVLSKLDPDHKSYFEDRQDVFSNQYQTIFALIRQLNQDYQQTPVIATEPIFQYMSDAIGLSMHGQKFQTSIMNDVPPTITSMQDFEDDLNQHRVNVIIYNSQVVTPLTARMLKIAVKNNIPVVGVSEMLPPNTTYIQWMLKQLNDLQNALSAATGRKS